MLLGAFAAVVGSVVVAVGHFVLRRGVVSRTPRLERLGLVMTIACAAAFDVAATLDAPRTVVAPLGALVVVWSVVGAAWPAPPSPRNVLAGFAVSVGAAAAVAGAAPGNLKIGHASLALLLAAALAHFAVGRRSWTLGAFVGCVGPFVAAALEGDGYAAGVVLAVASAHALEFRRVMGRRNPAEVAPGYVAASACAGSIAGVVATGASTTPLLFAGLLCVVGGALAVDAPTSQPSDFTTSKCSTSSTPT